jgi:hypothetical protein
VRGVRPTRSAEERLQALVETRLAPGLAELGFTGQRDTFVARTDEVAWLLALEKAPWCREEKLSFTVAWAVDVRGLRRLLGEARCPIDGRIGQGPGSLQPRWYTVPTGVLAPVLERRLAAELLHDVRRDVLPRCAALADPAAVQRALVDELDPRPNAPSAAEAARLRAIIAISVLRGERDNAGRWLDYLQARSSRVTAPDVVAERLAPLRELCLAS